MTSTIKPSINYLTVEKEKFTIPANTKDLTCTVTVPSGWTFVAVIECTSSGWAGLVYATSMSASTVHVVTEQAEATARDIYIHYLVRK